MATQNQHDEVGDALDDLGAAIRQRPSVRDEVMRRVTEHATANGAPPTARRWGGRRLLGKLAAAAACGLVGLLVWNPWGRRVGATEAFAAAVANVERARTFSCRQVISFVGEDGGPVVHETRFMYKEPSLERVEHGGDLKPSVTVTDHAKRLELILWPEDKTATVQDRGSMYMTDERTGEVKLSELRMSVRDHLLRVSAKAVKDLGRDQLNGRDVWVVQSDDGSEPVTTVYIDLADGRPVQIEQDSPSQRQTFTYADIRIDEGLDDELFSLEPPEGYAIDAGRQKPADPAEHLNGMMMAKTMGVLRECFLYMNRQGRGQWPETLDDLAANMEPQALQTLLAAPESKDGKRVLLYRRPNGDEAGPVIVVYESPEFRRDDGVVCGFIDGHAELIPHAMFKEMMK